MNILGGIRHRLLPAGTAGLLLLQSQVACALLTTTTRLDLPDETYRDVRAEGRACVTVQDGGRIENYEAAGESFTAVQTGSSVENLKVTGSSTAHVCGGAVRTLTIESGATVRITGGSLTDATIKPGGCLHVYGTRIVRSASAISGRWLDGTPFSLPIPAGEQSVVVHDNETEALPETGPYAHYRMDETGALQTYDGTTFLHRAAGGNYITAPPAYPSPIAPTVDPQMPPLTGQGYSTRVAGGASATIPGTKLPDLDQGATISFWIRLNEIHPGVLSVMSKAIPNQNGHPRSLALCLMGGRDLAWISDGGPIGPRAPINVGETNHLVLVFAPEGNRVSGTMYKNGEVVGQGIGGAVDEPGMDFNIGGWAGGEPGADGLLDDVQIYDRPLTPDEVSTLYSNPGLTLTDLDSDTMLDDLEYASFGNLAQSPGDDYDRDGLTNEAEIYSTLTDPGSYASRLGIVDFESEGARRTVVFTSVPGVSYQLEYSANGTNWTAVGPPSRRWWTGLRSAMS